MRNATKKSLGDRGYGIMLAMRGVFGQQSGLRPELRLVEGAGEKRELILCLPQRNKITKKRNGNVNKEVRLNDA